MAAKFIGWENSPFQAEWDSRVWASELQESRVQSKHAVSLRDTDSTLGFLIGRGRRSHLPDERRAQFLRRRTWDWFSQLNTNADCRLCVFVAFL